MDKMPPPPLEKAHFIFRTNEQDIYVSSDPRSVFQDLLHTTEEHAENRLLDVLVTVDAGGQRASQLIKNILIGKHKDKRVKSKTLDWTTGLETVWLVENAFPTPGNVWE